MPSPLSSAASSFACASSPLLALNHLDHAAHGEQRIEIRRLFVGQRLGALGRGERLDQRSFVQANGELSGFPAQREIERAIAAGKRVLGERSRLDLEPFEPRWHADAKLKPAPIDAPHLPMPARLAMDA